MATFIETVDAVRNWVNRTENVIEDNDIEEALRFAADDVYRVLRIPPFESTLAYDAITADQGDQEISTLSVPTDLSEVIELRLKQESSFSPYTIYSAKSDIRSFYENISKFEPTFTREGNNFIVAPMYGEGDEFELFYYRRLADLDAQYSVVDENADDFNAETNALSTSVGTVGDFLTVANSTDDGAIALDIGGSDVYFVGNNVPNWLRDENEKLLRWGALAYAYDFLNDTEYSERFKGRFEEEMLKLNAEENKRRYMGGNLRVHFDSYLI